MTTRFDNVNLTGLPAPEVIETLDYEAILSDLRDDLVARMPEIENVIDLESEPARKLMEAFAYRELILRARINDSARAVLLPFAGGADLEAIGALFGVARQDGEDDDRLRRRILLAPEAYGTAGAAGAYVYHALSQAPWARDVSACKCRNGRPGIVQVNVMADGDDPKPTSAQIRDIADFFARGDVTPMTDMVQVMPPVIKPVTIKARLTLYPGPQAGPVRDAAIKRLTDWAEENRMLGHDLRRSAVMHRLHIEGVHNVYLEAPVEDLICEAHECYRIDGITVTVDDARDE